VWRVDHQPAGALDYRLRRTKSRLFGPDDKIVVDSFNDPKVARAQTGGIKGALGVTEDTSDASIACRQIVSIKIIGDTKGGDRGLRRAAQPDI